MGEYIDKKAVTKFIDDCLFREEKLQSIEKETLLAVKRWIDAIPSADVRPVVRGRWIDYDDDYGAYICSKCEENAPEDIQWNFCPNCGADMREVWEDG